jgi:hypothetical protein
VLVIPLALTAAGVWLRRGKRAEAAADAAELADLDLY